MPEHVKIIPAKWFVHRSYFPTLFPKAALQNDCLKAAMLQSYFSRRLPKAILQSGSQKLPPKLLSKVARQNCAPLKPPPKVNSESCFPKLLSKATPRSCRSSKQLFINAAAKPQSCSPQLLPKAALHCPYATESRVPKKLQSCSPKLPQSWSGKLSKAAPQSCYLALLPKLCPKAVLQSCRSKVVKLSVKLPPKAALQSDCSSKQLFLKVVPESLPKLLPKRFPEAASQSCSPKHLCKAIAPKRLCFKPVPQSSSPKLFSKAAPESSCRSPKLR